MIGATWLRGRRLRGDRGTTLVEVMTALVLTSVAASALVGFASGGARLVGQITEDDPLALVAIEALSRDLRAADTVEVVAVNGAVATSLDIVNASETVRWMGSSGSITRQVLPSGVVRTMVADLDSEIPLAVRLFTSTGASVDHTDSDAVRDCTRREQVTITDAEGRAIHDRSLSMRSFTTEPVSC